MSLERKTTALEFETMLRRHLRRGGGPVSACSGFDPDRASAYLEGVLGAHSRERYEAHLAGCPACRRHMIELSRLSQLTLQPEATPAAAASWWKLFLPRVDPAFWHLNWRLAGAVLASCAVLVFLTIARPWRRSAQPSGQATAATAVGSIQVPAPAAAGRQIDRESEVRQIEKPSTMAAAGLSNQSNAEIEPTASRIIPKPRVPISPDNEQISQAGAIDARLSEKAAVSANPVELVSPPPTPAKKKEAAEFIPPKKQTESAISVELAGDQLTLPMVLPRMTPNPEDNPMQSGFLRSDRSLMPRAKAEKAFTQNQKPSILTHVMDYMKGYVLRTGNYERFLGKEAEKDLKELEESNSKGEFERPNKLVKHFRGKTFRFIRGFWIDDKYDQAMSAWRITFLRRGSEEYNRVLGDEPQLADFFDFGPIIIVWQDKIYRVTGK